jgi:hypothetical protein
MSVHAATVRGLSADGALIDGEAVVFGDDGRGNYAALMTKRRTHLARGVSAPKASSIEEGAQSKQGSAWRRAFESVASLVGCAVVAYLHHNVALTRRSKPS